MSDKINDGGPAVKALLSACDRISRIIDREIGAARLLPREYGYEIDRVSVSGSSYDRVKPEAVARVKQAQKEAEKAEQRRGEIERDEKLAALSIELQSLRAALPSLAGAACIALGVLAREIANGDQP